MIRRMLSIGSVLAVLLSFTALAAAAAPAGNSGSTSGYVMVALASPAAATYEGGIASLARTKPERGRLDTSSPAYAAYQRHLENEHANFRASLGQVAPGAEIVREYYDVLNGFAVKLNGNTMTAVSRAEGATRIDASWLYEMTQNVSPYLINADDLWGSPHGRTTAGSGVRVGVIDSGIDDSHPFFDCKGDTITHQVFVSGEGIPTGLPALVFDHGTHVAGTIGGCVFNGANAEPIAVDGKLSGVAPGVELHDYNVFPGFGAGFVAFGGSAFSHDIAAAIEKALSDGMDVVNMSLGGGVQGPHDFLAEASDAAVDAGMVVVVSAGNEGPGDGTIGSPGSAANVITAGASTNSHLGGVPVTEGGNTYVAAAGDFGPYGTDTSGALVEWSTATGLDATACTATAGTPLSGAIALVNRGACTFSTKVRNTESAGAVGVIVVNNAA
ncbi:MAG: S8 family serine peptidase, partial [Acidimicrobiia bacterium]|nr:S8 family serine peptidase [Acidimicrobiia bacterium]